MLGCHDGEGLRGLDFFLSLGKSFLLSFSLFYHLTALLFMSSSISLITSFHHSFSTFSPQPDCELLDGRDRNQLKHSFSVINLGWLLVALRGESKPLYWPLKALKCLDLSFQLNVLISPYSVPSQSQTRFLPP